MIWNSQDLEMYMKAKEYVDTVVMPLLPVSFGEEMKDSASMCETIQLLSFPLERQFKGRLLMLPGFTYVKEMDEPKLVQHLKEWEDELLKQDFKFIFYLTADSDWRFREDQLDGTVIWLPMLQLGQLDEKQRNQILNDQVRQIMKLFVKEWKKETEV
mgnify:CR=1 FL=1